MYLDQDLAVKALFKELDKGEPNEEKIMWTLDFLDEDKKQNVVSDVLSQLSEKNINIDANSFRDSGLRKLFSNAFVLNIAADVMQKINPDFKFDASKFLNPDLEEKDKVELRKEIRNLLDKINTLEPDPGKRLKEDELDKLTDAVLNEIWKPVGKTLAENEKGTHLMLEIVEKATLAAYKDLYGGVSPKMPYMTPAPVLQEVSSTANIVYQGSASPESHTILDEKNRFDQGAYDYSGRESILHVLLDQFSGEIDTELVAAGNTPTLKPTH